MRNVKRKIICLATLLMILWAAPALAAMDLPPRTETPIPGGTVYITNNFGASDVIEVELDAVAAAPVVYRINYEDAKGKPVLLGSINIKKNTKSGRLNIGAARFNDYSGGFIRITDSADLNQRCDYEPTSLSDSDKYPDSAVTLRNCEGIAPMLIVDKSVVTPGMTVTAVINGKILKGAAKTANVDYQLSLVKDMEEGTVVWYTIASLNCRDIGYKSKTLGAVEVSAPLTSNRVYVFFQGDNLRNSSAVITGLNPGDTVRLYNSDGIMRKTSTVPADTSIITMVALELPAGGNFTLSVTEKGKKESPALTVSVPMVKASAPIMSSMARILNYYNEEPDGDTASATLTVSGLAEGDIIKVYDLQGILLKQGVAALDPEDSQVKLSISGLDLGSKATTVYVSRTAAPGGESTWVKVVVPTARIAPVQPAQ